MSSFKSIHPEDNTSYWFTPPFALKYNLIFEHFSTIKSSHVVNFITRLIIDNVE